MARFTEGRKDFLEETEWWRECMVWAAFGYNGTLNIQFIQGTLKAADYITLLETHLEPVINDLAEGLPLFQQDNASIHRARATVQWLNTNLQWVNDWPSKSPDLNPIENLWGIVARAIYRHGRQFEDVQELKEAITTAWNEIPLETLRKLINSMPNRVQAVIEKDGHATKY